MESKLLNEISNFEEKYYQDNSKNTFFKKNQKMDLAKQVSNNFDINILLKNLCYSKKTTNQVVIDYNILKLFANEENFELILKYILNEFTNTINTFGNFEVHMNLNSFTISAAERYKKLVELFCKLCLNNKETYDYSKKCSRFYIYNVSNTFEQIVNLFKPFVSPDIKEKVSILKKSESSDNLWNSLIEGNNIK
tara:strand:- start:12013 stop:12594 length:582 start_codon:yes stop_codon:yes gene_type:complete